MCSQRYLLAKKESGWKKRSGGGWSVPIIYVVCDHTNKTIPAAPPLSIVIVIIVPTVLEYNAMYNPFPPSANSYYKQLQMLVNEML
jgi:hypothetical protein